MVFIIKQISFCGIHSFVDEVKHRYNALMEHDDLDSCVIIAKYDDTKKIVEDLIRIGFEIHSISELTKPIINGYYNEYVITLLENSVLVEPAKRDNNYLFIFGNVCYVFDDCNSKILKKIETTEDYEVSLN